MYNAQNLNNFFFNRYAKYLERRINEYENREIENIRNIQDKRERKTL